MLIQLKPKHILHILIEFMHCTLVFVKWIDCPKFEIFPKNSEISVWYLAKINVCDSVA